MKKMWKLNNKAVSPVIATILMVAITVVLAAVLYVMVMGFGSGGDETPTASLSQTPTSTGYRITILSVSTNDIPTTGTNAVVWLVNGADANGTAVWAASTGFVTAGSYIDLVVGTATGDLDAGQLNTIAIFDPVSNNNIATLDINVPA